MTLDETFPRKLGVKEGHLVVLGGAPPAFAEELSRLLAASCTLKDALEPGERADVLLLWAGEETAERFPELQRRLQPDGALWVVIPKKPVAQRLGSNVTFDRVQAAALATSDLVDNKTLTFDKETYGIRFVIRKEKRPAPR